MPLGLLAVAHLPRFRAPVLTVIATPLILWGMWGFSIVLAMGYVPGTVAPTILPVDRAVALDDRLSSHPRTIRTALLQHLVPRLRTFAPACRLLGVPVRGLWGQPGLV